MAKLQHDNYEEIKIKIVELFEKNQINQLPVDCFLLAEKLGFEVIPYSQLSEKKLKLVLAAGGDAYTIENITTGEKFIFYKDSVCIGRQRFTILHEIGHYVLDHVEPSELAESEADFFAKYSLAPMPIIHLLDIDNFIDIANAFNASAECAYNIMSSYDKWLQYGPQNFTNYEKRLIALFKNSQS